MIWGAWRDPNFEFHATDQQGVEYECFCFANSEAELRGLLTRKKLTVEWVRPYSFATWEAEARRATDRAIWQRLKDRWTYFQQQAQDRWTWLSAQQLAAIDGVKERLASQICQHDGCSTAEAGQQIDDWTAQITEEPPPPGGTTPKTAIKFRDAIWQAMKFHLFALFHGKCAYCECKPLPGDWGQVEHYRPKAKVDEDPDHPGYYWLAYDRNNFFPACGLCNGQLAKMTHFPVAAGTSHAHDARHLASEEPLLLNPYDTRVNPFDHLEFDDTGGSKARGGSPWGEQSRTYYRLDRPGLSEARFEAMQEVEQDWNTRIGRYRSIRQAYDELQHELRRGEQAFSAARRWQLERVRERTVTELMSANGI